MEPPNLTAESLFNVRGIVAVVTGGGTGIGLTITKALLANGASKIYIIGRRVSILEAASLSTNPSIVIPLPGDITDITSLSSLESHIRTETGHINLLVANAGIMGPRPLKQSPNQPPQSLEDYRAHALKTPMSEFNETYAVNTTGVYYTAMTFLSLLDAGNQKMNMGESYRSQILTTGSIAGFSRLRGASFAYNSSKAAVTHMMKMMATALVPYGIRCNVLAPGIFPSVLAGEAIANLGPSGGGFERDVIPAERAGREEDVAGAVLWLASRAGAYVNGSVVVVDGGRLGVLPSSY